MNRELLYMLAIFMWFEDINSLNSFHRIRGGVKSYVVATLASWSIPFSLSQPRPLDFFRVDRMSLKSFLSLQVSTQVPGELLTEVGHMCKSRVESCHVFDWLEYFFGWENTMILEVLEGTSSTNGALLPKSTFGWSLWRSVSIFQGGKGGIFIADTQPCLRCSSWLARPKWEQG